MKQNVESRGGVHLPPTQSSVIINFPANQIFEQYLVVAKDHSYSCNELSVCLEILQSTSYSSKNSLKHTQFS